MTRFERRQMFERLCELRDRYVDLPEDDRLGELRIEDAIAWAMDLLAEPDPATSTDR